MSKRNKTVQQSQSELKSNPIFNLNSRDNNDSFNRLPKVISQSIFKNYLSPDSLFALMKSGKYLKQSVSNQINELKLSQLLNSNQYRNKRISLDEIEAIKNILIEMDLINPKNKIKYVDQKLFTIIVDLFAYLTGQIQTEYLSPGEKRGGSKHLFLGLINSQLFTVSHILADIIFVNSNTFYPIWESQLNSIAIEMKSSSPIPKPSPKYIVVIQYLKIYAMSHYYSNDDDDELIKYKISTAWQNLNDYLPEIKEFKDIDMNELKYPDESKIINLFINISKMMGPNFNLSTFGEIFDFTSFLIGFAKNFGMKTMFHDKNKSIMNGTISTAISGIFAILFKRFVLSSSLFSWPQINLLLKMMEPVIDIGVNYLQWKHLLPEKYFRKVYYRPNSEIDAGWMTKHPSYTIVLNLEAIKNDNNTWLNMFLFNLFMSAPKVFLKLIGPSVSIQEVLDILWIDDDDIFTKHPELETEFLIKVNSPEFLSLYKNMQYDYNTL